MLGIQVFNYPNDHKFFKDECVEFNFRWLTETLKIDPGEITFVEDVWAGGGNLGPSIEYFVRGMEVGNMVFMQYKTFHDGSREELDIKVIDTGIGLERVAWICNGSATSYQDTFANAYKYLIGVLDVEVNEEVWEKFGPYSCTLDIDESDDIDKAWQTIADKIGVDVGVVQKAIQPVKEIYIVLDHTRTVMMTVVDGGLPSNVGGGGNVRNILRRTFSLMKKNGWWDTLGMEGFLKIFECHQMDLEGIYGKFPEYKSFALIMQVEYDRWKSSDDESVKKLEKILKQRKGQLKIEDWIMAMQSYGIPADKIAEVAKTDVPKNLYYEIALKQERTAKKPETVLYNTTHLPQTQMIFYEDHNLFEFEAKIIDVFENVLDKNKPNIIILDRSAIYPTSGGQQHDTGEVKIQGCAGTYQIIDAIKVGKAVLHTLDRPLEGYVEMFKGKKVTVALDEDRRKQLQSHHTGTHIVFAACRNVLGPHIWQNGAKKTIDQAHLDITHFQSLTKEEERAIENYANRVINDCTKISKSFMDKAEAERQFGFKLYQGGVVPGNELRVVNIEGVDTEACCGTHCDSTAEVGWIKLIKTQRISDGIVRLYYVAQERAITMMNKEMDIMNALCDTWGVDQTQIEPTAIRFFNEYKRLSNETKKQAEQIVNLQLKYALKSDDKFFFAKSEHEAPTLYFSYLPSYAAQLKEHGKGFVFFAPNFIFGLVGIKDCKALVSQLEACCKAASTKPVKSNVKNDVKFDFKIKGKKPVVTKDVCQFNITGAGFNQEQLVEILKQAAYVEIE